MSIELKMVIPAQKEPISYPLTSGIVLKNEINDPGLAGRYKTIWPLLMSVQGIQYAFGVEDPFFSAFSLCSPDYTQQLRHVEKSPWIPDAKWEYLIPLVVDASFIQDFRKIVTWYLETSPKKVVLLYSRFQGGDEDTIVGPIVISDYFECLSVGKIMCNTCYIVVDDQYPYRCREYFEQSGP